MAERLLRAKQVAERVGMSKTHLYRLMANEEFPRSVQLTPNGSARAWLESEIDEWIDSKAKARNAS